MGAKNGTSSEADSFALAAGGLAAEVHTFETLTERLGRLELTSEEKMTKAGELLAQAAQSHQRFVELLREMVGGIENARRRQNESAVRLSRIEEVLVARRGEHENLRQRFEVLGEAAKGVRGMLAENGDGIDAARARLAELIATAKDLAGAARAAQLVDLEREGHAVYQQLEALSRKLERVSS